MSIQRAKKQRVHVSTTILPELKDALDTMAQNDERSIGYVIERAVIEYLGRHAPTNPSVHTTL